ncbi:MAG: hypothetical protein ACE37K_15055 [Planctomycetota bacterium]
MNRIRVAVLLSLLVCLGGCLELDGQDVYLRFDVDNDRIDAMFIHRGVFAEGGNGSGSDPIAKAIKDLDEASQTGEFVFWNNWPMSCNPSRDYDAPRNALLKHIDVENGGLFTDPKGELCAYQFVRINKAKSFVKKLNTLLELAVQATGGIKPLGNHQLDDESKDNIREFLRSREKMLTIEDGRIELRLPFSPKDHRWFKKAIEDHFLDNMPNEITRREAVAQRRKNGGVVTDTTLSNETVAIDGVDMRKAIERAPSYRFFWDNDISIQRTLELTTIGIGVTGADELHVHKARSGLYNDALLKKLNGNEDHKIESGLPDQELMRRFDAFGTRDAKLPELLAKKRA